MDFTPGPWEVGYHSESGKRNGALVYEEKTQGGIAGLWATLRSVEECDRNAELITAAPDLYWACRCALADIERITAQTASDEDDPVYKTISKLKEAIRKAERKGP